ncbi:MAG TPA: hypothetical protein VG798_00550 [Rhizomicrobium sp.]|nr:hypothetical protein [Rhizomicrobium sp.]
MYTVMAVGAVVGVLVGTFFNSLPVGIGTGIAGAFAVGVVLKYLTDMQGRRRRE